MALERGERKHIMRLYHEKMIWTRFGTIFLGLWLLTSPETFGYIHTLSRYSDLLSGALLVIIGLVAISFRFRFWIWASCLIGIWLQFAPLLFWAKESAIYLNDTLIGILAIAFCVLIPTHPKELDIGPMIPPGWTYNPSTWQQRIPIVFFAIVGWFVARYLASYQLHYIDSIFDPFGQGTEKVITSVISKDFPVSDAGLGAMAYSLEAIMAIKGGVRRWHLMPWIVVTFGILVVPLGLVSIILVMLQPIAVGAWCSLCLVIATCMLIMLALTVDEVFAVLQYLIKIRKTRKEKFWKTFFQGSEYLEDGVDTRAVIFSDGWNKNLHAMVWGVRIPLHLLLTAVLGVWILISDSLFNLQGLFSDILDVLGALIVVFSIIAWAEVIRTCRWINIFLGLLVILTPLIYLNQWPIILHYGIVGLIIVICSFFRGTIKESYGIWTRYIK